MTEFRIKEVSKRVHLREHSSAGLHKCGKKQFFTTLQYKKQKYILLLIELNSCIVPITILTINIIQKQFKKFNDEGIMRRF